MEFAQLKEYPFYQPLLLGVMTLLASAALAWTSGATRSAVAEAEARDLRDSLTQVLPEGFADNDLLADSAEIGVGDGKSLRVYRARSGGTVKGVVFTVIDKGYGGEIVVLMAVDENGGLLGARVLNHTETPGLGDKIESAKSGWIDAFTGKTLATARWAVKKDGGDFDQFAGATVTPRAVVSAIKGGLEIFARHRTALLEEGTQARAERKER
jgi:electron transport complex protein RnfG